MFKGENLLDMDPEARSLAGLFMSFQSPVEIPGVSNIDFLNMAYNARRKKLGLPELGPIEVSNHIEPQGNFLVSFCTEWGNEYYFVFIMKIVPLGMPMVYVQTWHAIGNSFMIGLLHYQVTPKGMNLDSFA